MSQDKSLRKLKIVVIIMGIILLFGMVFMGTYSVMGIKTYIANQKK